MKDWIGRGFNWLSVVAAYYGTIHGAVWATNFVMFAAWVCAVCAFLFFLIPKELYFKIWDKNPQYATRSKSEEMESHIVDVLVLLFVVFAGWWWTAGAWFFQWLVCFYNFELRREWQQTKTQGEAHGNRL